MQTAEKVQRVIEICEQRQALDRELVEIVEGGGVVDNNPMPTKRKYTKRSTEVVESEVKTKYKPGPNHPWKSDRRKIKKLCCGSAGWKHKNGCVGKDIEKNKPAILKEENVDDDEPAPEDLRCGGCEKQFRDVLLDAICPACGSSDIYKMQF